MISSRFQTLPNDASCKALPFGRRNVSMRSVSMIKRCSALALLAAGWMSGVAMAADCIGLDSRQPAGVNRVNSCWLSAEANLFPFLPASLKYSPAYRDTSSELAQEKIIGAGFAIGSEFLWEQHYAVYRGLTQRIGHQEMAPESAAAQVSRR